MRSWRNNEMFVFKIANRMNAADSEEFETKVGSEDEKPIKKAVKLAGFFGVEERDETHFKADNVEMKEMLTLLDMEMSQDVLKKGLKIKQKVYFCSNPGYKSRQNIPRRLVISRKNAIV